MALHTLTDSEKTDCAAPVDYSFRKISDLESLQDQKPRVFRLGRAALRSKNHRFLTRALWLNHNRLTSVKNIESLVNNLLDQPSALGWLDFSFNRITEIDEEIANLIGLKVLYFHGNLMTDMTTVAKLGKLSQLRTLTMHGNPLETTPGYREHLLQMVPQVKNLDFAPVVLSERSKAPPYALKPIHY